MLATALGFIALGQTIALLLAGVDLSVGPLAGFLVVVASFFVNDGQPWTMIAGGIRPDVRRRARRRRDQRLLIRFANFTPDRRDAGDVHRPARMQLSSSRWAGRIHQCFRVGGHHLADWADPGGLPLPRRLRRGGRVRAAEHASGWQLRAVGSDEESARRIGLRIDRIVILGYVSSSLFAALGAVMLMAQIGVGDPQQGVELHAFEHHGGGPWRHEPAGWARHVRRDGDRRGAPDGSAERRRVSGALADLSIRLSRRAHPDCRADLFERSWTRSRLKAECRVTRKVRKRERPK